MMKKTTQNIIQEGSGSSRQSKTRQFMRQKIKEPAKRAWKRTKELTKLVFKHPKTALAATAITIMLLTPVKTSAQDISGKTELISDKEPVDKTPLLMKTVAGTNTINLGNGKEISVSKIQLLGAENFDGTEEHLVQKSPTEGWLHFFFNEKWNGFLSISEKTVDGKIPVGVYYPNGKGEFFKPLVMIKDIFQNFVVVGTKGIDYSVDGSMASTPLASKFGVEKLENPGLEESTIDGKKVVTLRVSNSTGRAEFYYDKNGKLEDFKSFDGIAISQR